MRLQPLALAAALVFAGSAHAFNEPTDWAVGDAGTTYQEWTGAPGSPINLAPAHVSDPALAAPVLSATGAFIASSGGYYSFAANYSLKANVANYGAEGLGTWVIVQTGATLNPDLIYPGEEGTGGSVLRDTFRVLDSVGNVLATSSVSDVIRTLYDPAYESSFGTVQYEQLSWSAFLPGYTGDFTVDFGVKVHSSFQELRIDSAVVAVPEPGTYALLLAGLGAVGFVARRRRSH